MLFYKKQQTRKNTMNILWKCSCGNCSLTATPDIVPPKYTSAPDHFAFLSTQVAIHAMCTQTLSRTVWTRQLVGEGSSHPTPPSPPQFLVLPAQSNPMVWRNTVRELRDATFTHLSDFITVLRKVFAADDVLLEYSGLQGAALRICGSEEEFCRNLLPFILQSALNLPESASWKRTKVPLLRSGEVGTIKIDREVGCGLLATMFLCVWPTPYLPSPSVDTVNIEMLHMFSEPFMACFLQYFEMMRTRGFPPGDITVRRVGCMGKDLPDFAQCSASLTPVTICEGSITDDATSLQADFANRYIGGGVLSGSPCQEEIRFISSPECLLSLLVCGSPMAMNEAILLEGTTLISRTTGYSHAFQYSGPYPHPPSQSCIVAVDALEPGSLKEYRPLREVVKTYVALRERTSLDPEDDHAPYATGNWGCGAFGGDVEVMSLVQWVACSACGRQMRYYPFTKAVDKQSRLTQVIHHVKDVLKWDVGKLFTFIQSHSLKCQQNHTLFDAILKVT